MKNSGGSAKRESFALPSAFASALCLNLMPKLSSLRGVLARSTENTTRAHSPRLWLCAGSIASRSEERRVGKECRPRRQQKYQTEELPKSCVRRTETKCLGPSVPQSRDLVRRSWLRC